MSVSIEKVDVYNIVMIEFQDAGNNFKIIVQKYMSLTVSPIALIFCQSKQSHAT